MKTALNGFAIALVSLMLVSCASFRVLSRQPLQSPSGHAMQSNDRMQVRIEFNQPVDRRTVRLGETFILTTEKHENVRGRLRWSRDGRSVTFRSLRSLKELFVFDPDGQFNLQIIGTDTGKGAVRDRDGEYLDGDNDNMPGGNYDTTWVIKG